MLCATLQSSISPIHFRELLVFFCFPRTLVVRRMICGLFCSLFVLMVVLNDFVPEVERHDPLMFCLGIIWTYLKFILSVKLWSLITWWVFIVSYLFNSQAWIKPILRFFIYLFGRFWFDLLLDIMICLSILLVINPIAGHWDYHNQKEAQYK